MAKADPLEGQLVEARYRLERRSGSGGMSVVYLAQDQESGQALAIKFLRSAFANLPDFVRRFEQEAMACQRLDHDNCVNVMGHGVAFGSPYLALEYLEGETLAREISRAGGPLDVRRAIELTRQVLAGLSHAHERGVVHRDLKPGNIMLVQGGSRAKIMDFGTAQLLSSETSSPGCAGTDVGTPWYMAPEQAAGQPTDQRTDLYSVGVMLFEMLTGNRPFTADDPMRVLEMHLSSPIPSARALKPEIGLSPELEAVMVRAMQKQPVQRFASARDFDEALAAVPELQPRRPSGPLPRQTPPTQTPAPSPAPPPAEPPAPGPPLVAAPTPAVEPEHAPARRKGVIIAALVVTTLLALALLLVLLVQTGAVEL